MIKRVESYFSDRWQKTVIIYKCTLCNKQFDSVTEKIADIKKHECENRGDA